MDNTAGLFDPRGLKMSQIGVNPLSPSSLQKFETCPAQYHAQYIARSLPREPESPWIKEGNKFHKAMEDAVELGKPLPPEYAFMEEFLGVIIEAKEAGHPVYVEQDVAITPEGFPTRFFDRDSYMRCKIDVLILIPNTKTAVVIDYKTGKRVGDSTIQEVLNYYCARSAFGVDRVITAFAYVKLEEVVTGEYRSDVISPNERYVDRIIREFFDAHYSNQFPAKTSGLCKAWCSHMQCPYNGKLDQ